jgi:RNA helicase armi
LQQLGPVLVSNAAKHCDFDRSLLERLSEHNYYLPCYGANNDEFDPRFVTKLKKNYRSLPSILHVYSHLFYDNQLEAEVNEENSQERKVLQSLSSCLWNRQIADEKTGVFFVNVNGRNLRTPESSSWFNDEEASRVFLFACRLKREGISMENVGVITPYSLQVKRMRGIFEEAMPGCGIKIGSVEEFQGQERDIILVSTVRTNHKIVAADQQFGLGFLQCGKRMNVAISRARALLVVFGKESLLAQDSNWRYLIQYTRRQGSYVV